MSEANKKEEIPRNLWEDNKWSGRFSIPGSEESNSKLIES
jgi:hypothetical protein